jgi:hypothetical protein
MLKSTSVLMPAAAGGPTRIVSALLAAAWLLAMSASEVKRSRNFLTPSASYSDSKSSRFESISACLSIGIIEVDDEMPSAVWTTFSSAGSASTS